MHLESISNGLGAQSMELVRMAGEGLIPATVSISADTGWENDRTWSNGKKSTTKQYFEDVCAPLCERLGIIPRFARAEFFDKTKFPPLIDHLKECAVTGKKPNIPMFGSRMGRLRQVCTDKWKIRALRQEARRMGAKTNRNAQGIHFGEADRRVKGRFLYMDGIWSVYQTTVIVNAKNPITGNPMTDLETGKRTKVHKDIKWQTHYYPLVDLKMKRGDAQENLRRAGIPFLLSSECDGCPHKDLPRWLRTSPEVMAELSAVEAMFNGELFFTPARIPLLEAIEQAKAKLAANPEAIKEVEVDFGCGNAICGI